MRDILGEAVALRVSKTAATVPITFSASAIYPGDQVELGTEAKAENIRKKQQRSRFGVTAAG